MHRQFIYSLLAATALTGFAAQAFADNTVDLSNYSDSNETFNLTQIKGNGNKITVGNDPSLAPMQGNSNSFTLSEVGNANWIGLDGDNQGVGDRVTRSNVNLSATGDSNIADVHMDNADQNTVNMTITGNNNGNPKAGAWRANVTTIQGTANTANTILNGNTNSMNMGIGGNANIATIDFEGNQNSGETDIQGNNNNIHTLVIGSNNGGPFISTMGDGNNDTVNITGTNSSVNVQQGGGYNGVSTNGTINLSLNGDNNTSNIGQFGNGGNITASAIGNNNSLGFWQVGTATSVGNNMNVAVTGNSDLVGYSDGGDSVNSVTINLNHTNNFAVGGGLAGSNNTANITTYGADNGAVSPAPNIEVGALGNGDTLSASIGVLGDAAGSNMYDTLKLNATGNGNSMTGIQEGSSNSLVASFDGDNNQGTFTQIGSNNVIGVSEAGGLTPNRMGNLPPGNGNNITGTQTGTNNLMLINVAGDANTLTNTQSGYDTLYETVNGTNNNIRVNQTAGSSALPKSLTLSYTGANANVKLNQ